MTAHVLSATTIGFEGELIEVECDSSKNLPALQIVGLGNKAIDEAKERVRSAITNSGFSFPASRITINLAPANLPKDGAHFDLPIALAILIVSGQLRNEDIANSIFAGELSLDGKLRPIRGSINIAETARQRNIKHIFLPKDNATQAALINDVNVIGITSLTELFLHLKHEQPIDITAAPSPSAKRQPTSPNLDDIHGQTQAKRALTIAAAGHHNILFTGPPGSGKTMLAKALRNLLPSPTLDEQIAITKLQSLAGETEDTIVNHRPFRSPHHTASHIALVGGGHHPRPGEMSLAHLGVLFLDELPEYPRSSLEAMRQPLEDGAVSISRANHRVKYPAHFMLVATQNPCPCGYYGDTTRECTCSLTQITTYQKRISGPLLDRIDMIIPLQRVEHEQLLHTHPHHHEETQRAQQAIQQARAIQHTRYQSEDTNALIGNEKLNATIKLTADVKALLATASDKLKLTARSYFKIIKVARTIADLEAASDISSAHLSEALQYRQKT